MQRALSLSTCGGEPLNEIHLQSDPMKKCFNVLALLISLSLCDTERCHAKNQRFTDSGSPNAEQCFANSCNVEMREAHSRHLPQDCQLNWVSQYLVGLIGFLADLPPPHPAVWFLIRRPATIANHLSQPLGTRPTTSC